MNQDSYSRLASTTESRRWGGLSLCPCQNLGPDKGRTVVVRIQEYQDPAVGAAFPSRQQQMAAEFVFPVQEPIPAYPYRRQGYHRQAGAELGTQTVQQDGQGRDLPVPFHDSGDLDHRPQSSKRSPWDCCWAARTSASGAS